MSDDINRFFAANKGTESAWVDNQKPAFVSIITHLPQCDSATFRAETNDGVCQVRTGKGSPIYCWFDRTFSVHSAKSARNLAELLLAAARHVDGEES